MKEKEMIENIAERFTQMDDVDKSYIAGYMAGKQDGTSEMGAAGKDSGCNSMRVGLIDVDGHNFPNIPLMKLSAWHKQQGDTVEWYEPLFSGHMNRVYMSKVFSFTQDYPYFVDADEVIRGGSGYCIELTDGREHYQKERDKELPPEVEHIYPDYSIYPELTQDKAFTDF